MRDFPPGLSERDNELGWRMALERLASFVASAREPFKEKN
jgi:hypothetical protein